MFIGHLPAGYITATVLQPRDRPVSRLWWWAALLGSVFPDLDLFYFYLVDNRQTLHHHYFTHLPAFWLCMSVFALAHPVLRIFLINVLGHLILDTMAGGILWLWPVREVNFVWLDIPAVYTWWVWNFVLHWSFVFEITLCVIATYLWHIEMRRRHGFCFGR